jgi:outer membrane protein
MSRTPAKADEIKIGYVDIYRIFDEYNKTADLEKELEEQKNIQQSQIDKVRQEIDQIKDELDITADQARADKQKEFEEKIEELRSLEQAARLKLRRKQATMRRDILLDIYKTVQDYGKRNNYTLILVEHSLLYGDENEDLTEEILGALNSKYTGNKSNKRK